MNYYLGLDNGGTNTKAALFDSKGTEIAVYAVSSSASAEKPGFVERDMEQMWEDNCLVIKEVVRKASVSPEEIKGIGICGHGKGMYLWGKDDRPVRMGIISTDNRAYAYASRWKKDGTEAKAFQYSYQHVMACQPVALLAWLKDNEPENYRNIRWVFECKDYIRFRLTGEAKAEITDYSGTGLMNLSEKRFDERLLELFGISEIFDALPPVCSSTEIAGYVTQEAAEKTGLKAGTPVIGGMFDINACAIASGVLSPERICMIAGTWSINEYPNPEPVLDGTVLINSLFCIEPYYLVEESSPTSAGNLEWFINALLPEVSARAKTDGKNIYKLIDEHVASIPADQFVPLFLPFLMASNVHPNAKGSFIGLSVSDSREVIARSIFEGICYGHRWHYEKLLKTRSTLPDVIRLSGGAANSQVWTQMFADVMKTPVETVKARETGALGCAVGAAAASGEYASIEEAVRNMSESGRRTEPDPDKYKYYDDRYRLYCRIIEQLDPLWDDIQKSIEKRITE